MTRKIEDKRRAALLHAGEANAVDRAARRRLSATTVGKPARSKSVDAPRGVKLHRNGAESYKHRHAPGAVKDAVLATVKSGETQGVRFGKRPLAPHEVGSPDGE